jgi:hypothetical protein
MAKKKNHEVKVEANEISAGENPAEELHKTMLLEIPENSQGVEDDAEEVKIEVHAYNKKDRIAIFTQNWMEVAAYSPTVIDKNIIAWRKGQVVYLDTDIDRLLGMAAPIKVYVEDGAN